ncbi:hypothetical protein [Aquiflexum sp.]|uniref:hypothetical protein n=1 Tax=Aquiflexum sp. TaxID=1872584 RepID=UPI0035945CDA
MNRSKLHRLIDLIEEIKKIDEMIMMHRDHGSDDFMSSQYESKKSRLLKELISELVANSNESSEVFNTIGKIIFKFYPNESSKKQTDLDQLVAAIG